MKIPIPLNVVAESSPHEHLTWMIRTRNPFLMALAEPRGIFGLRLHCGPPEAAHEPADKLQTWMSKLAALWCEEVEEMPGLPEVWDHVFTETPPVPIPGRLVCDNADSRFTGILTLYPGPRFWLIPNHENTGIHGIVPLDAEPPGPDEIAAAWEWWLDYCAEETALPDEEEEYL